MKLRILCLTSPAVMKLTAAALTRKVLVVAMNRSLILSVLLLLPPAGRADSTISSTEKFAFAANAGWINFRPVEAGTAEGVVFGDYFLSGRAYAANFGWIDLGDGSPANGVRYQNNTAADCGVNHDGAGNLSGFAYAANAGWINFGWASAAEAERPRVNLLTGAFSGYAWSANLGWISLGGNLTATDMICPDSDSDGISDSWEHEQFNNLTTANAASNQDGDSATDLQEFLAATDPRDAGDFLKLVAAVYNSGRTQVQLTFTTKPARLYRLQTSTDLAVWTDSAEGTFAPDAGATTTRTISWQGGARHFVRAIAIKPL